MDPLFAAIGDLIEAHFLGLRKPVRRNLTRLGSGVLHVAASVRFGYGGLRLTSIARALPDRERFTFKSCYKWLSRFLKCRYFDPSGLAESMLGLILGRHPPPWVIVLIDQTTIDGVQVVNAAIPLEGRAVPVTWVDFEYPWKTLTPPSQNTIERYLLTWLAAAAPPGVRLILVFDRGYARVELVKDLNQARQPFVIRVPTRVIVQAVVGGRRRRLSVGRLPHHTGTPIRYRHVLYHGHAAEPVDIIVYRERAFREAWYLVVPPDSEAWLPTDDVIRLYRQRMQIEQCFRDWKSHLGLRGLRLQVQKPERLLRVLMGFTLAYLLTLLLGQDPLVQRWRSCFELPRRHPRHGTTRILSVLSLAIYLLADPRWAHLARERLVQILSRLSQGRGARFPSALPP
jgi:hypothetical protein